MPAKKKTVTAETEAETATAAIEEVKPAKKTTRKSAKKAADTAAEEKPAAKKTTRKTAAKKTADTAAEEKPAKKTARKSTKKTAETAEAKPAKKTTRKSAKKAAAAETPAVEAAPAADLKSVQDYEDIINWKKGEAHASDWLYIEINAGDLLTEVEAGSANLETVCAAMRNTMLEGDGFITEPAEQTAAELTVRYYTDNLSADRKKYSQD